MQGVVIASRNHTLHINEVCQGYVSTSVAQEIRVCEGFVVMKRTIFSAEREVWLNQQTLRTSRSVVSSTWEFGDRFCHNKHETCNVLDLVDVSFQHASNAVVEGNFESLTTDNKTVVTVIDYSPKTNSRKSIGWLISLEFTNHGGFSGKNWMSLGFLWTEVSVIFWTAAVLDEMTIFCILNVQGVLRKRGYPSICTWFYYFVTARRISMACFSKRSGIIGKYHNGVRSFVVFTLCRNQANHAIWQKLKRAEDRQTSPANH